MKVWENKNKHGKQRNFSDFGIHKSTPKIISRHICFHFNRI